MKIILQESYMNLGEAGDVVSVKPGYARNFLIPQKIAVSATPRNLKYFQDKTKELEEKKLKERKKSENLLETLKDVVIKVEKKVGDDGKLYGAVSAVDVEESLAKNEIIVDRRMVVLGQQIKMLGNYEITIKLVGGKKAVVPLQVVSDAPMKKSFQEEESAETIENTSHMPQASESKGTGSELEEIDESND